ncbi:hypothetical protein [Bifidobacterium olomucense]|uniref:Beta-mannosidase n=1 Tax=Bifidobacterium olomucense TaxID=2675324 RepID=A0A7Y0HX57_9BIFI|nr:hypothetical protein [Bifidobacterium sp. DSM 109959]NMM98373.1 beta-mannosidase [Bifidobacterium sp. DSM 109959]
MAFVRRVAADHLALVIANDTLAAWVGTWTVERRDFDGTVLASQSFDVTFAAGEPGHVTLALDEAVATFGDASREMLVATPVAAGGDGGAVAGGFARVIYNPADVIDQRLDRTPLDARVAAVGDGYTS